MHAFTYLHEAELAHRGRDRLQPLLLQPIQQLVTERLDPALVADVRHHEPGLGLGSGLGLA